MSVASRREILETSNSGVGEVWIARRILSVHQWWFGLYRDSVWGMTPGSSLFSTNHVCVLSWLSNCWGKPHSRCLLCPWQLFPFRQRLPELRWRDKGYVLTIHAANLEKKHKVLNELQSRILTQNHSACKSSTLTTRARCLPPYRNVWINTFFISYSRFDWTLQNVTRSKIPVKMISSSNFYLLVFLR